MVKNFLHLFVKYLSSVLDCLAPNQIDSKLKRSIKQSVNVLIFLCVLVIIGYTLTPYHKKPKSEVIGMIAAQTLWMECRIPKMPEVRADSIHSALVDDGFRIDDKDPDLIREIDRRRKEIKDKNAWCADARQFFGE
ncbi:hypothetical protein [Roseiarcus fermentans]|uniref:hypothetical protein n=1 Tax=Roseiarcus fermentans TaxID=1473586 RepID=UPI0011BEECA6|nr:hypothetical protein [Roseiarcus fermentans]